MIISIFFLYVLLLSMLPLIATIPLAKAWSGSTITIQADGSVDPPSAPVQQVGNVYILTDNVTSDSDGIIVEKSGVTLNGNGYTIQGSSGGNGVDLTSTSDVTVENLTVESFSFGIFAPSVNYETIALNNIEQNSYGIWFESSSNNNVYGNNIQQNSAFGIYVFSSQNNNVYSNNFVNNAAQVYTTYDSNNIWDNGYPSGGNYWSDYNGHDYFRGAFQNVTGSDGIGDTPYTIDVNNIDFYPLMNPWSPHDVAVTNVLTSRTVVGQGYDLNITVTAANLGTYPETFNVTVDANAASIGSQTVILPIGSSANFTLVWNTKSFPYSNHTISAYAWPVPGETNIANNNFTSGVVTVTISGDLNGDFKVNLSDLTILARAYGSHCANYDYQGESAPPNWNPNADINGDGKVSLSDLTLMARHYGQSID
jgi:parallel beta-helix repeat protein